MDYQQEYDRIISQARSENRKKVKGGTYYEAHHIIPECMGGEGKTSQWKTHPNIVLLTAKEHFFAHYYLMLANPKQGKLAHAFWLMCNAKSKGQERDYSEIEMFAEMYEEGKRRSNQAKVGVESPLKGIPSGRAGIPQTPEHIARRTASNRRAVDQYTAEGFFIERYESQRVAEDVTGVSRFYISDCVRDRQPTAGGFIWREALSDTPILQIEIPSKKVNPHLFKKGRAAHNKGVANPKQYKPVHQYDKQGNHIRTWNSIREAANSLQVQETGISACAAGRYPLTVGGFIWRFEIKSEKVDIYQ